ncbi:hypothetical protein [Marasmitruncus massiliensis]|uniref:hypothetical protein n=1 Tax=Marasmitruncus massiliensis TaxID=1944642 RepID=UPI000C7A6B00|nr:hypothetical protein [Marasmitruncus massiliensis]
MKKWIALALSLALIIITAVPAFAASSSIVGELVDADGKIASDGYDTIRPGSDYYYVIAQSGTGYDSYVDDALIRFSLKKKEGGKYITDADLVEKKFGSTRYICIKFSVKDNFSDDEYKVVLEANFRAKKDLVITNATSYNSGLAFPAFRAATSSDGSYTQEQINAAQAAYNNAISERNTLNNEIAALKTEIAALEKQIEDLNQQNQQRQAQITAAQTALSNEQTKLAQLKTEQSAAQTKYNNAKSAWDAAKEAADQAEHQTQQKAQLEADLQQANTDLAAAQALQAKLGPEQFTAENPKPDPFVPKTLIDRFNAANTAELIQAWNNSLVDYTAKAFTPLAEDNSNNAAVAAELNAEIIRVNGLIADANNRIATATADLNSLGSVIEIGNTELQAAVNAEQSAKTELNTANSNVTTQETVVTDAQKKLNELQASASTPADLANQLAAQKSELASKQAALPAKEKAVTDTKAALDNMLAGTGSNVLKSGDTFTHTFKIWVQNEKIEDSDATFTAGEKGVIVKPVKNEINTVTWEDSNRTLAVLTFRADSDVSFYCPRLSTRWNSFDYADYFDDTDAYLFDFVSSPTIPASSRPTLSLYNPFVDDDGDLTVRTSRIRIYEIVDGDLEDVTDLFTFERNEDDDYVMTIKTRTLGTYIVSDGEADLPERPSGNYSDDDDIVVEVPSGGSVTGNTKPVPFTGR